MSDQSNWASTHLIEDAAGLRPEPPPSVVSSPVIETDYVELDDRSVVELIEDPENSSRTLLAIYKNGQVRFAQRFQHGGRVFVPIPRERHLIRHVRLPRGAKPYESVQALLRQTYFVLSKCLDLSERDRTLLSHFILSTWLIDRLPVAPYIALVGLPRSGKSTTLSVLNLLCRRGLLTADITSAAFYRVCDRVMPTLLIDETNTAGEKRALFHLLRTGTTRDAVALRREQAFRTFGAKVVSFMELPDDAALNSRCIVIAIREPDRVDLMRPSNPEILHAADELQQQFLQFRFEKSKTLALPSVQGDKQLRSRARDLYEAMALPVAEDRNACEWLVTFFKAEQEANREPLSPIQAAVLHGLFIAIHGFSEKGTHGILELTNAVNSLLKSTGEGFRVRPRGLGAALTSFGLRDRKRTNKGWLVWLDQEAQKQIHELVGAYGIDSKASLAPPELVEHCELCKKLNEEWEAHHFVKRNLTFS